MRIAIIGTGISGLTAPTCSPRSTTSPCSSPRPPRRAYEHGAGRSGRRTHEVDTGFIVFNNRNYPSFTNCSTAGRRRPNRDMSFTRLRTNRPASSGEEAPSTPCSPNGATWCGPAFLRMLVDVTRFNRAARRLLLDPPASRLHPRASPGDGRWSASFLEWYLVPLGSAIWSADPTTFARYPAATFARFFDNHGLLRSATRRSGER